MNNRKIEKSLRNAVNSAPVIPFVELAALPYIKMSEHDYITSQQQKKTKARRNLFALATACCLLIMVSVSGWYRINRISDSVITLDVNPSIEIITNQKDKIIAVKALNDDAEVIIGSDNFKDTKLEDTVDILLSSLIEYKYLDIDKNTILVTVMNKNSKKADDLLVKIDTAIRIRLATQNITPTIVNHIISMENGRSDLASQYHISEGKMELIQYMISLNDKLTLEVLSKMSVEQLLKLAEENSMNLTDFISEEYNETSEEISEDASEYEDEKEASETEDNELQGEKIEDDFDGDNEVDLDEDNEVDSVEDNEVDSDEDNEVDSDEDNEDDFDEDNGENSGEDNEELKDKQSNTKVVIQSSDDEQNDKETLSSKTYQSEQSDSDQTEFNNKEENKDQSQVEDEAESNSSVTDEASTAENNHNEEETENSSHEDSEDD